MVKRVNGTEWDRDVLATEAAARVSGGQLAALDHTRDFAVWVLALLKENEYLRAEQATLIAQLRQACLVAFSDLLAHGMPPDVSTGQLLRAAIAASEEYFVRLPTDQLPASSNQESGELSN